MAEREGRPSPDALLAAAKQEGRGRLKIFLGAAPGVGKTYEMLLSAQAKRRDGVDVVVGVVESHGRRETEALLEGLEVIPRQQVEYKGHLLAEMDLDAILKRRPQLVLVDELAHTNAPGSRHPKRYLDVEEIIAAGIDVFADACPQRRDVNLEIAVDNNPAHRLGPQTCNVRRLLDPRMRLCGAICAQPLAFHSLAANFRAALRRARITGSISRGPRPRRSGRG